MTVNGELEALTGALDGALARLRPEGRVVVITFESLSDRIVKQFFTEHVGREVSLQQGGSRWEGQLPQMAWVQRKALRPTPAEVAHNPRARSAKLRAVRLPTDSGRFIPSALKNRAAPAGANDKHTHLEDE
jgi:16S rRNA (cytosine1402-N4)-methyltransferase